MITILGAGGAIANELVKELCGEKERVRLASRNPKLLPGAAETVAADISDLTETIAAVSGSTTVYLVVGLKYDRAVWKELWPRIMHNTIQACKRAGAKLIFFDNVYMYGKVDGPMTEQTPFNPCSKKGEIRARIATALLEEMKAGSLTALIARCPDFYGPGAKNGMPNVLVFDNFAHGKPAYWLVNDSVQHSFAFTPDVAKSLVALARSDSAWNQTWHVPTAANPPTGKEFIELAANQFGVRPRYRVLNRPIIKATGWFNKTIAEIYEMLYQYDREYLFDSTKFSRAFGFQSTSYAEGIRVTANAYKAESGRIAA
jgi:nucleoside-diphosphate-sugar epimerase